MTADISHSARAHTAAEARFRVPYRNSRDRSASLIALDAASESIVEHAVASLPGRRRCLPLAATPLPTTDLLVIVAHVGCNAEAAALLGEACRLHNIAVTALLIAPDGTADDAMAHTLSQLRPFASMIVVAKDTDYIEDMLRALRA